MGIPWSSESNGEPFPGTVSLAPGSWELFKSIADSLIGEMHELGFPLRLAGVWRKLEAYLACLALILCMSRVAGGESREQIEPQDIRAAGVLIEYFKAHAKRVHLGLRGQNPKDQLAAELRGFLREHGGEREGEPNVLHEELLKRDGEPVPNRPDELSKMVLDIGNHSTSLDVDCAWRKYDGKSRRVLRLLLRNGVDPGVSSAYTDNSVNTNFQHNDVDQPGADNTGYTAEPAGRVVQCNHGYPGGKRCYLCDSTHLTDSSEEGRRDP